MANFHQIGSLRAPRTRTLKFPFLLAPVLEFRPHPRMFPSIQNPFSPENPDLGRNLAFKIGSRWSVPFIPEKSQLGSLARPITSRKLKPLGVPKARAPRRGCGDGGTKSRGRCGG